MAVLPETKTTVPTESSYTAPDDTQVLSDTPRGESGTIDRNAERALLVSSNAARTATANNVSKLQGITSNLQTAATAADTSKPGSTDAAAPAQTTATAVAPETKQTTKLSANEQAVSIIKDPAMRAQYKTSLDSLDSQAASAMTNLKAAKDTLANDPAAADAVAQIESLWGQKIQQMRDRNKLVIGKNNTSVAAFGGLGPMGQNFLSDQEERAQQRVTDLIAQEKSLILKAQIAYKTNDTKALNDAMQAYEKAGADKLKAINDLLTESHKQVTEQQAQDRLEATTAKAQLAADVSLSTNIAGSLLKNIEDSGLSDQDQIDQYLGSVAEEYGITNTDILRSALLKAKTTKAKDDLSIRNTTSIINKRNSGGGGGKGGGTDGGYSYTKDDVDSYTEFLNKGGTGPNGTAYNGRGKNDQYVDPGAYVAALQDWVDNGGTPQGFVKKFPVTSINPASYSKLPAAIRPKAKTSATPV